MKNRNLLQIDTKPTIMYLCENQNFMRIIPYNTLRADHLLRIHCSPFIVQKIKQHCCIDLSSFLIILKLDYYYYYIYYFCKKGSKYKIWPRSNYDWQYSTAKWSLMSSFTQIMVFIPAFFMNDTFYFHSRLWTQIEVSYSKIAMTTRFYVLIPTRTLDRILPNREYILLVTLKLKFMITL